MDVTDTLEVEPETILAPQKENDYRDTENHQSTAVGILETWAANLGSCPQRRGGKRVLQFDEGLMDVADQVSSCLAIMPMMVEVAAENGWTDKYVSGFATVTQLLSDSAIKAIKALDAEREFVKHENRSMQKRLSQIDTGDIDVIVVKAAQPSFQKYASIHGVRNVCSLGAILVDCLAPKHREELQFMVSGGASLEQIQEYIKTFTLKENSENDEQQ